MAYILGSFWHISSDMQNYGAVLYVRCSRVIRFSIPTSDYCIYYVYCIYNATKRLKLTWVPISHSQFSFKKPTVIAAASRMCNVGGLVEITELIFGIILAAAIQQ